MLISASLLIRDQKIVQEVSAEWGDIEETGEDAGREENVLEDYLEEERHRLFQSGSAYQCIFSHQKTRRNLRHSLIWDAYHCIFSHQVPEDSSGSLSRVKGILRNQGEFKKRVECSGGFPE